MTELTHSIKPIKNQILVKLFPGDDKSTGGIVVAESFRAESNKGEVIAVGNGTKDRKMQFKKGDIVFRVQGHGEPFDIEGQHYYMMDQNTILATG
jgi:chaperonin GroES